MKKPPIPFYMERTFSQKFSDTVAFLQENWRVLLRWLTLLLLPVCLLQGLTTNSYFDLVAHSFSGATPEQFISMGGMMVLGLVMAVVACATVFAVIRLYNENREQLATLTFATLRPLLWRLGWRLVVLGLLGTLVGVACCAILVGLVALVAATGMSGAMLLVLLWFLLVIAAVLPLVMVVPSCLLSDDGLWTGICRGGRYAFHTWAGVMGIMLVAMLITNAITGMASIPFYVCFFIKMYFISDSAAGTLAFAGSPLFTALTYVLTVFTQYASMLCSAIPCVAMAYQYAHAAEKIDGVAMAGDVERFEQYGVTDTADDHTAEADEIDDFEKL